MFDDWLSSTHASSEATSSNTSLIPNMSTASAQQLQGMSPPASSGSLPPFGTMAVAPHASASTDLQSAVRLNEHQMIMATLASTPSKTEAAKRLGISPRTLRYKMAQLREQGLALGSPSAAF
jgi:two-component system response regulator FlrC